MVLLDGAKRMAVQNKLKELIVNLSAVDLIKETVNRALQDGTDALDILRSLNEALNDVGKKYDNCEYFLSELIMAGVIGNEVACMLAPYLNNESNECVGTIVIGTVKGDIHDIGKNILVMMLRASRFEVIDLGVDVTSERFVEAVRQNNAVVLGLSALLTSTRDEMRNVIEATKRRRLRDKVKIVVGGRPVTASFSREIGADGYAETATEAVKVIKELLQN